MTATQLREMLSLRKAKDEEQAAGGVNTDAPHEGERNIAAGEELSLPVFLSVGERLSWRCQVESRDVDFGVTAFPGGGPLEVSPLVRISAKDGLVEGSASFEEIMGRKAKGTSPIGGDAAEGATAAAAAAAAAAETAAVATPAPGARVDMVLCRITFSNTYSWFTSKDVMFKVTKAKA